MNSHTVAFPRDDYGDAALQEAISACEENERQHKMSMMMMKIEDKDALRHDQAMWKMITVDRENETAHRLRPKTLEDNFHAEGRDSSVNAAVRLAKQMATLIAVASLCLVFITSPSLSGVIISIFSGRIASPGAELINCVFVGSISCLCILFCYKL
jgi:hypothetical protein